MIWASTSRFFKYPGPQLMQLGPYRPHLSAICHNATKRQFVNIDKDTLSESKTRLP